MAAGKRQRTLGQRTRLHASGRLLVAGLLALVAMPGLAPIPLAPAPQSVNALSCAQTDLYEELARADYVFIGTPQAELDGPRAGEGNPRRFLFDVETWIKGNLGTPVVVTGFEWEEPRLGQRKAMVLRVAEDGTLRDQVCLFAEPDTLLAIAELEVEEPSNQPPALLIGGSFGDHRLMGLDAHGRLARLGEGEGTAVALAACPGGDRIVEVVADFSYGRPVLATVRDAETLTIVREIQLPFSDHHFGWADALQCRDEAAQDVLIGMAGVGIVRLGEEPQIVHEGFFTTYALSQHWAVIAPTDDEYSETRPTQLSLLELATGKQTALPAPTEPGQPGAIAFSPNQSRLAYVSRPPYGSPNASMQVHLFDPASGQLLASQRLESASVCDACQLNWLDDETLLVRDEHVDGDETLVAAARVFRLPDLELVEERSGIVGRHAQFAAGTLLSVDWSRGGQRLLATRLEDGRQVDVRVLPTNDAAALLALAPFDESAVAALFSETPAVREGEDGTPLPNELLLLSLVPISLILLLIAGLLAWRRRRLQDG